MPAGRLREGGGGDEGARLTDRRAFVVGGLGVLARPLAAKDRNTVFGRFKVDPTGVQIGHKMLTIQWQDGKKAIVWPEELAPGKPRFPTPPWSRR